MLMTKGIDWCPVGTSWHRHILFPQQQWLHLVPEAEVSVEIWLKWCCKSLTWLRLTNWLLYSSFSPMQLVHFEVSYKSSVARDRSLLSFIELLGLSRIWSLNSGCRLWLNHAQFLSIEHWFQCLVAKMGQFAPAHWNQSYLPLAHVPRDFYTHHNYKLFGKSSRMLFIVS